MAATLKLIPFLLLLLVPCLGLTNSIEQNPNTIPDVSTRNSTQTRIQGPFMEASTVTCEPTYGFLPCTTEVWGKLFLILVYEYLLSLGESYVSTGSDLFFQISGPGIIGSSVFQFLGTIPEISLVLASGLSGSKATAERQAAMGMAVLVGSAVMLLTLVWGSCILFGSSDFPDSPTTTQQDTPNYLTGFGVITDVETTYTARITLLSMVPILILQLATILNSSAARRIAVLISLIVTLAFLLAYAFYQVFQPWIQKRRFEYLTQKFVKDKLLSLLTYKGRPDVSRIKRVFNRIDRNKDGHVSTTELRTLIMGIELEEDDYLQDDYLEQFMEEFDISGDAHIDVEEFVNVISKWILKAQKSINKKELEKHPSLLGTNIKETASDLEEKLVAQKKESRPANKLSRWNYIKALFYVVLGTAMLAALAHPLIESVADFADGLNISSFFIPYLVIPLAMNYGRAVSSITSARKKTQDAVSLTLSAIYGSVFMNIMIGLTVFLSLVYVRDLSWDVSAEILVVLIISIVMGAFTSILTKFPIWSSFLAFLLYPVSLLLLYILTAVFGWS